MPKESKEFQKFRSKIDYLYQHLQVVDASIKNTTNWLDNYSVKSKSISVALGLIDSDYPNLNHPVKNYKRIFSYTRARNSEYSIIELYNAFTCYLKDILKGMYENEPIKIVGKVATRNLTFVDIVNLGTFDKVSEKMIKEVFRMLEDEKSTPKLLDKILNHTSIVLNPSLKNEALMYLEMRHMIIHNDGKADERFVKNYNNLITIRADKKLATTFNVVNSAMKVVFELTDTIDKYLTSKNYLLVR